MFESIRKAVLILITLLMLVSCKDASPQTKTEKAQITKDLLTENMEQFLLGASKLCAGTDYQKHLGSYREPFDNLKNSSGNCCSGFVSYPYINPYEYYLSLVENEKSIDKNKNNPFELKKIRASLKKRVENVQTKVKDIDEEKLFYKSNEAWIVSSYDMSKETLQITGASQESNKIYFSQMADYTIPFFNIVSNYSVSVSSDKAEQLFEVFEKQKSESQRSYLKKPLNSRVIYSLRKPLKNNHWTAKFEAKVKKIEFFEPTGWDEKIGEITF